MSKSFVICMPMSHKKKHHRIFSFVITFFGISHIKSLYFRENEIFFKVVFTSFSLIRVSVSTEKRIQLILKDASWL